MWLSRNVTDEQRHTLLVVIGVVLLLVAGALYYFGAAKSEWPLARAQVLTVAVKCEMQSRDGFSRHGRRQLPVVVGCDQVDQFRADNPGRSWSVSRRYQGDVRVIGDAGTAIVSVGLSQSGRPPRVGDVFDVVQNPAAPADIAFVDQSTMEVILGYSLGGLGIFLLVIAFALF